MTPEDEPERVTDGEFEHAGGDDGGDGDHENTEDDSYLVCLQKKVTKECTNKHFFALTAFNIK